MRVTVHLDLDWLSLVTQRLCAVPLAVPEKRQPDYSR